MTYIKTLNVFAITLLLVFFTSTNYAGQLTIKPVITTTGTLKKLYPVKRRVLPTLPGTIGGDPNKDPYDKRPCKVRTFVSHEVPDNEPASVVWVGSWKCGK